MRNAQLHAFHAVAKWGGFSVAASKINLTQPAVSDHVRKLEEMYNVQLFVRNRRSVTLTELGSKLYVITERLKQYEEEARELLSRARGLQEGKLTIGADAVVHILPLLSQFRGRYPGIQIALTSGNSDVLVRKLKTLEIDFAVVAIRPRDENFMSVLLSTDPIAVFCAKDHALSSKRSVSLKSLVAQELILREQGSATRKLFDEICFERKLPVTSALEIEGREAAREAVAAGMGVGIVSRAEFVDDKRLKMLEISDWSQTMDEWLVCLKSRSGLQMFSAMLDLVGPDN